MNRIKSILTFIVLGYSDKCIQTYILFNESNLRSLSIDKKYLIYTLVSDWEEYRVFENQGKIVFKPDLDLRIFYKILFLFIPAFGLTIQFSENLNPFIFILLISNLITLLVQYKNNELVKIKMREFRDSLNYINYLKTKRLEIAISRIYFLRKSKNDTFSKFLIEIDFNYINEILSNNELISSLKNRDPDFKNDLVDFIKNIQQDNFERLKKCIAMYLLNEGSFDDFSNKERREMDWILSKACRLPDYKDNY